MTERSFSRRCCRLTVRAMLPLLVFVFFSGATRVASNQANAYQPLVGTGAKNYRQVYAPGSGKQIVKSRGDYSLVTSHDRFSYDCRVYFPPGTKYLYVGFNTYGLAGETQETKVAARFNAHPVSTAVEVTDVARPNFSTVTQDLLSGQELRFYSPPRSGGLMVSQPDMLKKVEPSSVGGWVYFRMLALPDGGILNMQTRVVVDADAYAAWFASAVWDENGNPPEKLTGRDRAAISTPATKGPTASTAPATPPAVRVPSSPGVTPGAPPVVPLPPNLPTKANPGSPQSSKAMWEALQAHMDQLIYQQAVVNGRFSDGQTVLAKWQRIFSGSSGEEIARRLGFDVQEAQRKVVRQREKLTGIDPLMPISADLSAFKKARADFAAAMTTFLMKAEPGSEEWYAAMTRLAAISNHWCEISRGNAALAEQIRKSTGIDLPGDAEHVLKTLFEEAAAVLQPRMEKELGAGNIPRARALFRRWKDHVTRSSRPNDVRPGSRVADLLAGIEALGRQLQSPVEASAEPSSPVSPAAPVPVMPVETPFLPGTQGTLGPSGE